MSILRGSSKSRNVELNYGQKHITFPKKTAEDFLV